jgi:hypothetical protein
LIYQDNLIEARRDFCFGPYKYFLLLEKIKAMYKLFSSIILILCTLTLSAQQVDIQEPCSIHEKPDLAGKKLHSLGTLDDVTIIAKSVKGTVNGKSDYWYDVEKVIYDEVTWEEVKTIKGYVFGHFTSFKMEGQQTMTLVFDGCEFGDCFHLMFGDYDFGGASNVLDLPEELCLDGEEGILANPNYKGKKMALTINDLNVWDYEYCNPDSEPVMIKTPTIVHLELAGSSVPMPSHGTPKCITTEDNSGEEYGADAVITNTCTYKNIKVVSTGHADYTGKYSYTEELYALKNNSYEPVKLSELLNEGQGNLLSILQAGAEKEFKVLLQADGIEECIEFTSLPTLTINDFELTLGENSISFIYNLDVTSEWACMPFAYVGVEIKITEFGRYLK